MPKTQKAGGGSKKIDRNKKKCERYRIEGRREKNKKLRQERREKKLEKRKLKKIELGLVS